MHPTEQQTSIPSRTGLLVSARNATEASIAFQAGVDIVDIKEPSHGALGLPDLETLQTILQQIPDGVCVSLAMGELAELSRGSTQKLFELLKRHGRIQFFKMGLSRWRDRPSEWKSWWRWAIERLPDGASPVAVVYADQDAQAPLPADIISAGADLGCRAVLVDTYEKSGGNVFDHLDVHTLKKIKTLAAKYDMRFVLAGSINHECLASAAKVGPDWIGVRGAVCRNANRKSELCLQRIKELQQALARMMQIRILN